MVAAADARDKLERLCRTITRPAVSTERVSLTAQGRIHSRLAAPAHPAPAALVRPARQDAVSRGHHSCRVTTGILPFALWASLRLFKIAPGDCVEPLDLIARRAALVPSPRVILTRYHGAIDMNWRTQPSSA